MKEKDYTLEQMNDAKQLAEVLVSVSDRKRPIFALMLEAMLIGAEIAAQSTQAGA